jgi:hypothetical protein
VSTVNLLWNRMDQLALLMQHRKKKNCKGTHLAHVMYEIIWFSKPAKEKAYNKSRKIRTMDLRVGVKFDKVLGINMIPRCQTAHHTPASVVRPSVATTHLSREDSSRGMATDCPSTHLPCNPLCHSLRSDTSGSSFTLATSVASHKILRSKRRHL